MTPPSGPDPRIERSRRAILQATLDELGEVGYGSMSIESIAARAGVGKATVYRHWRGKLDLLESALHTVKQDIEIPAEGSARERITDFLHALAAFLANSELSACMPALVSASQYDESVREFQTRFNRSRRQQLVDLVAQGIASGELDGDLDPVFAAEMLASPLFYRRLLSSEPYPPDEVERIVEVVLP